MAPQFALIINADDLGHSLHRDEGIFALFHAGVVTSASVLVNGEHVREAVRMARSERLSIGLHLNLTEGRPCAPVPLISSLVNAQGAFLGKMGLRERAATVNADDVRREIEAQLAVFESLAQTKPTHVDGHQHVHVLPCVAAAFAQTLKRAGVTKTRLPLELDVAPWVEPAARRQFYAQVMEDARHAAPVFKSHGLVFSRAFMGLSLMGGDCSVERVVSAAVRGPVGPGASATEFMVHPGARAAAAASSSGSEADPDLFHQSPDRVHEVDTLACPRLLRELSAVGAALCDYSGLPAKPAASEALGTDQAARSSRGCLAVVAQLRVGTGNFVTSCRLRSALVSRGWTVVMVDVLALPRGAVDAAAIALREILVGSGVVGCFGLHAVHAGALLLRAGLPYVLVLGGTDVNTAHGTVERAVLDSAVAIVAFNSALASRIATSARVTVVPQAIELPPVGVPSAFAWPTQRPYFILPIGIRAVKDPLFLVAAMRARVPRADLIICGPLLDDALGDALAQQCAGNVRYVGCLARVDVVCGMRSAVAVLNSSLSEGMSNALLEAMAAGAPVLARRNAGNAALVEHGVSGLLFDTPDEFVRLANALLDDDDNDVCKLRVSLVNGARVMVEARHSLASEAAAYDELARVVTGAVAVL